ncbi:hypothetical protein KKA14_05675 [bacterium]|nr:hypothetical protein [bacterium]
MPSKPDIIIKALVKKKKELLDELLVHSIYSALNDEDNTEDRNNRRQQILSMLRMNDLSIRERERLIGKEAKEQEKKLFSEIAQILGSIYENNDLAILKLMKYEKEFEFEKQQQKNKGKLSHYVQQTKKVHPVKQHLPTKQTRHYLLNGIA